MATFRAKTGESKTFFILHGSLFLRWFLGSWLWIQSLNYKIQTAPKPTLWKKRRNTPLPYIIPGKSSTPPVNGHAITLTYWLDLSNSSNNVKQAYTLRNNILFIIILLFILILYLYIFIIFYYFLLFYYFFYIMYILYMTAFFRRIIG